MRCLESKPCEHCGTSMVRAELYSMSATTWGNRKFCSTWCRNQVVGASRRITRTGSKRCECCAKMIYRKDMSPSHSSDREWKRRRFYSRGCNLRFMTAARVSKKRRRQKRERIAARKAA